MDFRQMSAMLSTNVKQQIILEHNRKEEDLTFLLDEQYLQQFWRDKLTTEEKSVIKYFLLNKGDDFLSYRELDLGQLPIPNASFRKGLTLLRRKGIIFTLRRLWGELAYIIPKELVTALRKSLIPYESKWVDNRSVPSTTSYHITQGIYQVLNYVRSHPIELTKKGTIQKKDLRVLFELLGLPREKISCFKTLNDVIHPYENHEAIMLDWLRVWHVLAQSGDKIIIGDVQVWSEISSEDGQHKIREQMKYYLELDEKLGFLYDIMLSLSPTKTYSLEMILGAMGEFAPAASLVEERIFIPLSHLGILKYAYQGNIVWEWVQQPVIDGCQIYVQPNFEILIPRVSSFEIQWTVGEFADLCSQEEMWLFSLNRDSVRRFYDYGKNSEILIRKLQSLSAVSIPENVLQTLLLWEKEYQRIQFFDVRVLEVSDPSLGDQLEKIPSIAEHIIQRLGERFFAVRKENWEQVAAELEKRGYTPGLTVNPTESSLSKEQISVFKKSDHKVEFKVESVFPDLEDAIPGLRQMPRMWTANFQPYHSSTLRDLVQKAVQIGVGLKVQCGEEIHELIPSSLYVKDGYWTLQGTDRFSKILERRLEDIQRIQVVAP